MLGYRYFVPGAFYQIITHRPDTHHYDHMFKHGEIVKCLDVTAAGSSKSILGSREFRHAELTGTFINSEGLVQVIATGDVRKCRLG